jgi:hypothetical protein
MFSPESNSVIRKWTREMQPILDEQISPSHLLSHFRSKLWIAGVLPSNKT